MTRPMSVQDVKNYFGASTSWVYLMMHTGKLPAMLKLGKRKGYRFDPKVVASLKKRMEEAA